MSTRSLVHQLLFDALLDMRNCGYESGDKAVFHLADLFHNVVAQMERADAGTTSDDYEEILAYLKSRAEEKGCEAWIQEHIDRIEAKAAAG